MTHQPRTDIFAYLPQLIALANLKDLVELNQFPFEQHAVRFQTEAVQLAKLQYLQQYLIPSPGSSSTPMTNNNNIITDVDGLNLLNSWGSPNSNPVLGNGNNATNSQPLHHIPSEDDLLLDPPPQVPFSSQTSLNSMGQGQGVCSGFTDHHLGMDISSSWVLPSLVSVPDTSISNPGGDASSTSSYNNGGANSPYWPELYFDQEPIAAALQEI